MPPVRTKRSSSKPKSDFQTDSPNLKTFLSHGVLLLSQENGEAKGHCPFCGGSAFFVNEAEGMFHCKTCPHQGNKYVFLQLWYDHCYDKTTEAQRNKLAKDRGLPVEVIEMAEYAYDADNKRWLVPVRKENGAMVNLGRFSLTQLIDGKRPVLMTAGCKTHLGNLERLGDSKKVYVCEGPWDCIALEWLLYQNKDKDSAVLWVPGCTNFNKEWAAYFDNKDVIFLYDNDDPGTLGMERACETIRNEAKPKSLSQIKWPDSFPEKFDIRDFVGKRQKAPKKGLIELHQMIEQVHFSKARSHDIVRTKFSELVKDFEDQIYVTPEFRDGLCIALSVVFSNKIFRDPYCPLWVYLIASAGSGKTLLLQTLSDSEMARFEASMGPKTLVSGFKASDGEDPSLLPKLIGKTLIIEDFTGIMSLSSGEQEEIYGALRSIYNGRYEKSYGHIGTRVYPDPNSEHETCHFTILAGCTGIIHADARANKGERFLKYHMANMDQDTIAQVQSAIDNTLAQTTPEVTLREPVSAFIDYKLSNIPEEPATIPKWVERRIIGLGQIVATVRAVVMRKNGDLLVRPEAEVATRISKQLIKLAQALCFTLDKKIVDAEVYKIVQRVGMDTCYGWHRDAIVAVAAANQPIRTEQVSRDAVMARTTAFRCMEDLMELGAVTFDLAASDGRGKQAYLWSLTPQMQELWRIARIDTLSLARQVPMGTNFKKRLRQQSKKGLTKQQTEE